MISLNENSKHRLKIITGDQKEYISDYLEVIIAPEMTPLQWEILENGMQVLVNSEGNNKVHFYRWEYEETWEVRTPYVSNLEYVHIAGLDCLQFRGPEKLLPNACYSKNSSNNILLFSTDNLSNNAIKDFSIIKVNNSTNRLRHKYSVLVKQYGLSQRAFQFWQALQKSSEGMGSIFDPMPSQLPGNVKCLTNPEAMVVGYVGAGTYSEKRVFIDNQELQNRFYVPTGYEGCSWTYVPYPEISTFSDNSLIPLFSICHSSMTWGCADHVKNLEFVGTNIGCVDCTFTGTDIKPDFWE